LTLVDEGDTQFLLITDTAKHQVYKTTLDGRIIMTIDYPAESGKYPQADYFIPTETTLAPNGDFYIADGYGSQYITRYDPKGKLVAIFGGRGDGDEHFDNAHGICLDTRRGDPTLLITDRTRHCFKRFSLEGKLLSVIQLPGACVCRPVIHGDHLYAAVLTTGDLGKAGTGFVTILDRDDRVVSNLGGTEPSYRDGQLQPMGQAEKIMVHPHDVMVDDEGSVYVAQWNSSKVYPYKFTKVA
jgi:hypothetical protein